MTFDHIQLLPHNFSQIPCHSQPPNLVFSFSLFFLKPVESNLPCPSTLGQVSGLPWSVLKIPGVSHTPKENCFSPLRSYPLLVSLQPGVTPMPTPLLHAGTLFSLSLLCWSCASCYIHCEFVCAKAWGPGSTIPMQSSTTSCFYNFSTSLL